LRDGLIEGPLRYSHRGGKDLFDGFKAVFGCAQRLCSGRNTVQDRQQSRRALI
jgi:hypothetical protein